ncbi:hypothetical protein [Azonexus sp.]|jgi:hypothetical protein|uniref:hypothetical protein n=1 Tax=Azonexus sp. TaxID=1872668 RepID=UPI00281E8BA3|nr:hypothetical protein [Azonexus sp.]MDR1994502.1 hypothetical protein [Azonexus sp.]
MNKRPLLIVTAVLSLAGCDQINEKLGLDDPAKKEARTEAEARAVGSACRHSGRAIEDCYAIYAWLPKAGVYAGWREMDEYMRENKIETIVPQLPPAEPPGAKKRKPAPAAAEAGDEAAVSNGAAPAADKGDKK